MAIVGKINQIDVNDSQFAIDLSYLNLNDFLNNPNAYSSKATARSAVPTYFRTNGRAITYKLILGNDYIWVSEQFIGSSWSTADADWLDLGPVKVSQNSETDTTNVNIGDKTFELPSLATINYNQFEEITPNLQNKNIYQVDSSNRVSNFYTIPARLVKKISVTDSNYECTLIIFKNDDGDDRDEREFYWATEHIVPSCTDKDTLRYQIRKKDDSNISAEDVQGITKVLMVKKSKVIPLIRATNPPIASQLKFKYYATERNTVGYLPDAAGNYTAVLPKPAGTRSWDFDLVGDEIFILEGKQYRFNGDVLVEISDKDDTRGIPSILGNSIVTKSRLTGDFFVFGQVTASGEEVDIRTNLKTDFIPITLSGVYVLEPPVSSTYEYYHTVAYFGKDKNFISREDYRNDVYEYSINAQNVGYIKICLSKRLNGSATPFDSVNEIDTLTNMFFYIKEQNVPLLYDRIQESTNMVSVHPNLVVGNVYGEYNNKRAKSGFLNGVKRIKALNGYLFAPLIFSKDGLTFDDRYYVWQTELNLDTGDLPIRFHVRNANDTEINIAEAIQSLIVFYDTDKFSGKLVSILGDSMSAFGVPDQNNITGTWTYPGNLCRYPQQNLFTDVDMMWWKRLFDNLNISIGINESIRGTKISWDGVTESDVDGADKYFGSQTRINHLGGSGTPDVIVIFGGANDASNNVSIGTFDTDDPTDYTSEQIAALPVATFADAYRTMLIRVLKTYPDTQIICCIPPYCGEPTTFYPMGVLNNMAKIIYEACNFFGIPVIDMRKTNMSPSNRKTYFMEADGIHPNSMGHYLMYNRAIKYLMANKDYLDGKIITE